MQAACFYPLTARSQAEMRSWTTAQGKNHRRAARGIPPLMVRGFANRVKRRSRFQRRRAPGKARACPVTPGTSSNPGFKPRSKIGAPTPAACGRKAGIVDERHRIRRSSREPPPGSVRHSPSAGPRRHRGHPGHRLPTSRPGTAPSLRAPPAFCTRNRDSKSEFPQPFPCSYGRQPRPVDYRKGKERGFPLIWRTAMRSRIERIYYEWGRWCRISSVYTAF